MTGLTIAVLVKTFRSSATYWQQEMNASDGPQSGFGPQMILTCVKILELGKARTRCSLKFAYHWGDTREILLTRSDNKQYTIEIVATEVGSTGNGKSRVTVLVELWRVLMVRSMSAHTTVFVCPLGEPTELMSNAWRSQRRPLRRFDSCRERYGWCWSWKGVCQI